MKETFARIKRLLEVNDHIVTDHAAIRLVEYDIMFNDLLLSFNFAVVVEDYPDYYKGPAVLILSKTEDFSPVHSLWGIPSAMERPATLITIYRPNLTKWLQDFVTRKK